MSDQVKRKRTEDRLYRFFRQRVDGDSYAKDLVAETMARGIRQRRRGAPANDWTYVKGIAGALLVEMQRVERATALAIQLHRDALEELKRY